jgi:hypothetical protein
MASLRILAVVLAAALAPAGASAASTSVIATWSRVGADGTTLANSLTVSESNLIARIDSSDGSVTTDSGPVADIDILGATICAHPQVMMITLGMRSRSFREVSDNPKNPADFKEDMFFLEFGDAQTERRVARALAVLTGVSVEYDSDCTSSE